MAALDHSVTQDEVIKNTFANYAFEHFEIAAYKSLVADHLGAVQATTALRTSLAEEESMAQWIDAHIATTTLTYTQRHAAGVKAGV